MGCHKRPYASAGNARRSNRHARFSLRVYWCHECHRSAEAGEETPIHRKAEGADALPERARVLRTRAMG